MNNFLTVEAINYILRSALEEASAISDTLRIRRNDLDLDQTAETYSALGAQRALTSMLYCSEDLRKLADLLEKSVREAKLSPGAWP